MLRLPAKLALENGDVFTGVSIGASGEIAGEVCFNTSMTGYQEVLTDPSYRGQIVAMTYPHIGNYGVNSEDQESERPWLSGFVIRELSREHSNHRATGSLEEYLKSHGIVGISDVDTRRLVRVLRCHGALKGVLSTDDLDDHRLVRKAQDSPGMVGRDLVREVIPQTRREWNEALVDWSWQAAQRNAKLLDEHIDHIVALDFGMKFNIARHLRNLGGRVTVLPGTATADEIRELSPSGVFLSNGPGDPEPLNYAMNTVRALIPDTPVFGICLGHQILALACGARTFKLKFGHRGANQPVWNCVTQRVEITTQNHGFCVEESSLPSELEVTHRHLNDDTIAGIRHRSYPAFGVQYHPEASAGPHDSHYLFRQFALLMRPALANAIGA